MVIAPYGVDLFGHTVPCEQDFPVTIHRTIQESGMAVSEVVASASVPRGPTKSDYRTYAPTYAANVPAVGRTGASKNIWAETTPTPSRMISNDTVS